MCSAALGGSVVLLDFLLRFVVDLDALSKKHRVHAGLGVGSRGVEQQVRQLGHEKENKQSHNHNNNNNN